VLPGPAAAQTVSSIRVAYVPFEGAAQVLYDKEQGFFAKEGLDVTLQPIPLGSAIASAVASDAVDIGFSAITTLAIAHEKQIPFVIVAPGCRGRRNRSQRQKQARHAHGSPPPIDSCYNRALRSRRAFVITDTELKDIASAAIIGLSKSPNPGYSTPAAIGIPMAL